MANEQRIPGRVSPEVYAEYKRVQEQFGYTGKGKDDDFIGAMLPVFVAHHQPQPQRQPLTLDDLFAALRLKSDEEDEVRNALQYEYVSLPELLKTGLLGEARRTNSHAESNARVARGEILPETKPRKSDRAGSTRRGSGFLAVQEYVHERMARNVEATSPLDRMYLTKQQVFLKTGINRQDINRFFDLHAEELQAHHQAIGLASEAEGISHNRRVAQSRRGMAPAV